ncbi:MAG TPA: hypothetical protein VIL87_09815 [Dermatophilaceae bacterium]
MPRNTSRPTPGIEKRGGYTGGQSRATVGPPSPIPSGTIKPTSAPAPASAPAAPQSSKPTS